jgi:hypothetical protein
MSSHMTEPVTSNGAATRQVMAVISDDYLAPASSRSVLAQVTGVLGILAGLWVAISPWFLVLQHGGNNAAASNLIVGAAIVALGLFAVSGSRGFLGLQVGSLIAGVWLIISPFILNAHYTITPSLASPPSGRPGGSLRGNRTLPGGPPLSRRRGGPRAFRLPGRLACPRPCQLRACAAKSSRHACGADVGQGAQQACLNGC